MDHPGWLSALWGALRALSVADVLDIAVVGALIYSLLLWFEWTKAAFVARGILILGVLYVIARQLGMVLTTWIFHGFFAVFVIALVIIFQEELRRFFERLAVWNFRGDKASPFRSEIVEVLLQTASACARDKTGALIVLRGRDPLDRHVEGGIELDGKLSAVLLQSIFDVHSEGHDGAVFLEHERVRRFGAHLPLSKNLGSLAGLGTRHAAALGISEVSDALCVVVSEQRGTISVAQNGTLRKIDDLHELERQFNLFLAKDQRRTPHRGWGDLVVHNGAEKILAGGLSLLLWLVFVQGFKPETRVFTVAAQVEKVSEGLRVRGISPHRVAIRVSGLKRDLDMVSSGQVKAFINVEGREAGAERYLISEDNVRLPDTVRFLTADPPTVEVDLAHLRRAMPGPEVSSGTVFGPIPAPRPASVSASRPQRL